MHRLVFEEGGLSEGTEVAYYSRGKVAEHLLYHFLNIVLDPLYTLDFFSALFC